MITRAVLEELAYSSQVKLPSSLEAIVCSQEDASLHSPSVPAHYYRFLYALAALKKPVLWLEIGTYTGISSACLADGWRDGRGITINILEELNPECERVNVDYFYFHNSLKRIIPGNRLDILFIDAEHNGKSCVDEFNLYKDDLAPGAIVMFDDIHLIPEMTKFWEEFNPDGFEKFELPVHGWAGFGVLIKKEAQEAYENRT